MENFHKTRGMMIWQQDYPQNTKGDQYLNRKKDILQSLLIGEIMDTNTIKSPRF